MHSNGYAHNGTNAHQQNGNGNGHGSNNSGRRTSFSDLLPNDSTMHKTPTLVTSVSHSHSHQHQSPPKTRTFHTQTHTHTQQQQQQKYARYSSNYHSGGQGNPHNNINNHTDGHTHPQNGYQNFQNNNNNTHAGGSHQAIKPDFQLHRTPKKKKKKKKRKHYPPPQQPQKQPSQPPQAIPQQVPQQSQSQSYSHAYGNHANNVNEHRRNRQQHQQNQQNQGAVHAVHTNPNPNAGTKQYKSHKTSKNHRRRSKTDQLQQEQERRYQLQQQQLYSSQRDSDISELSSHSDDAHYDYDSASYYSCPNTPLLHQPFSFASKSVRYATTATKPPRDNNRDDEHGRQNGGGGKKRSHKSSANNTNTRSKKANIGGSFPNQQSVVQQQQRTRERQPNNNHNHNHKKRNKSKHSGATEYAHGNAIENHQSERRGQSVAINRRNRKNRAHSNNGNNANPSSSAQQQNKSRNEIQIETIDVNHSHSHNHRNNDQTTQDSEGEHDSISSQPLRNERSDRSSDRGGRARRGKGGGGGRAIAGGASTDYEEEDESNNEEEGHHSRRGDRSRLRTYGNTKGLVTKTPTVKNKKKKKKGKRASYNAHPVSLNRHKSLHQSRTAKGRTRGSKEQLMRKRHSIGHTNTARLHDLKARIYRDSDNMGKIKNQTRVKWATNTPGSTNYGGQSTNKTNTNTNTNTNNNSNDNDNDNNGVNRSSFYNEPSGLPLISAKAATERANVVGNKKKKRRRSLFNKDRMPTPLTSTDQYHHTYDEINSNKWNIEQLTSIETQQDFYHTLNDRPKEDIIELCWDLLRSKDKSDELLRMVSIMNQDLEKTSAFDTMLDTVVSTLEVKFASLYVIEEESNYLKCLWTSNGEPQKDIVVSITSSTQLAARVYQKDQAIKMQLTQNNENLCPDFNGFGYVYVMGIPIRNYDGDKIGVLMAYRDRTSGEMFDDSDLSAAQMLTSIAATTMQNVKMYNDAQEKRKETSKILGIIDEMSGDASQGYSQVISKIVRKIRSLVTCAEIDFWTVDLARNSLRCEISHNQKLQDVEIERTESHILGQVAITGKYIKIDNARLDQRYQPSQLEYSPGESLLVIPVRVENETYPIAVIQAINKIPKTSHSFTQTGKKRVLPFTTSDRRLLESFATSSAIVIKNSVLFQRIFGLNRKAEAMVGILRALQQKHDVAQMLNEATLSIRDALEAERVSIWFEDGQGNLDALDFVDGDMEDDPEIVHSLFAAIARFCAEDKILINTPNIFEDATLWRNISDFIDLNELQSYPGFINKECSILCVPILSNSRVVGVIQSIYKLSDVYFTVEDQQIVEAVSSEVAHTIARNISDLCLQKYVERHEDIPLDVIDYYLTGANEPTYEEGYGDGEDLLSNNSMGSHNNNNQNHLTASEQKTNQNNNALAVGRQSSSSVFGAGTNSIEVFSLDPILRSFQPLLTSCEFDATVFENKEHLEQFAMYALDECGVVAFFKLNVQKLRKFVHNIAKMYRINPFHNWQHGFFVFHFVYYFIHTVPRMRTHFREMDLLAILIAGMCHDVDHPGNDNTYEIESETELARIYNGEAVLENHHAYTTLALLRSADMNFFEGSTLSVKQVKEIKKIITKSILSTDMGHHSESILWLNDWSKAQTMDKLIEPNAMKEQKKKATMLQICQCIVHMGDLSAQTYPWRIAKKWELKIAEEFKLQTVKEAAQELPVREWMAKTDLPTRYKNQHFFVKHVVVPLWQPAAQVFPCMHGRLQVLLANSKKYMDISTKISDKEKNANANANKNTSGGTETGKGK